MADAALWNDQRVLLTGHTGFKGAWLGLWLSRMGARVWGLSLPPDTEPSLCDLLGKDHLAGSSLGDIRDSQAVVAAVKEAQPTIVLHMAAQALVRRGYRQPVETFQTNVMGTAHVLEALRGRAGLAAVLVVTTDKVYRNLEDGRAFREDDPLGAHDPYSASKAAVEITVSSWAQSYFAPDGIPVVTARAGNVIGGGDWSQDRLVPDIWRSIHAGQRLTLRYPGATRPWQHVMEPLAGYLRYVELAASGEALPAALNFGPYPDDVMTVAEVADAMLAAFGAPPGWDRDEAPQLQEMRALSLDPALAQAAIGWRPRLTSAQAIGWTADWYGGLARGRPARSLCLDQISAYESLT